MNTNYVTFDLKNSSKKNYHFCYFQLKLGSNFASKYPNRGFKFTVLYYKMIRKIKSWYGFKPAELQ